jgi:hypothetical protein
MEGQALKGSVFLATLSIATGNGGFGRAAAELSVSDTNQGETDTPLVFFYDHLHFLA